MRNSDPRERFVFVHWLNSDLKSVLTLQATSCNFQYGPNLGVSLDPAFRLWCFFGLLAECIHDRPLHEIVRDLQCLSSWNTVRFQQHSEILHPNKICPICLVVITFQFVLLQKHVNLDHAWHEGGIRMSSHNGCPCSIMKGFTFFTHFLRLLHLQK